MSLAKQASYLSRKSIFFFSTYQEEYNSFSTYKKNKYIYTSFSTYQEEKEEYNLNEWGRGVSFSHTFSAK
jgi:hypothetical protein